MIAALEIPGEGQTFIELIPPPGIEARALSYALECGLKGELVMDTPTCVRYPIRGHGWVVLVREKDGKCRMGTVKFNETGTPMSWAMDGARLL